MKMLFKQRFLSWFDSYDIYDENDSVLYVVKGEFSWGHCLRVYDKDYKEIGMIKEKVFTWLPKFCIYKNGEQVGTINREFTFFIPKFNVEYRGWDVEGNFLRYDYRIIDKNGNKIASIAKKIFSWTDTYIIDVVNDEDALDVLMLVLSIDIEECTRNNN
ncbi:MAG: hypothetical protein E7177_08035 [Erysipelotrichaceae bacterium]|nr:hypothetical protein [Erysipelotrichaceae bacterium]